MPTNPLMIEAAHAGPVDGSEPAKKWLPSKIYELDQPLSMNGTTWMDDAKCGDMGLAAWSDLEDFDQAQVCHGCPAMADCRAYAIAINADRIVFAGVQWRNGKPRPVTQPQRARKVA